MAPIPVTGILFLLQSGYPADLVLRICVNAVNGLENAYGGSGKPRAGSPKFRELMTAMQESQSEGGMGFRVKATKDRQVVVMFIRPPAERAVASSHKVRELLGLSPDAREFSVESGSVAEDDREIAILTRSILQVMTDLASTIEVPRPTSSTGPSSFRSGLLSRSACFPRCSTSAMVRRRPTTPMSPFRTASAGSGSKTATSGRSRSFPS